MTEPVFPSGTGKCEQGPQSDIYLMRAIGWSMEMHQIRYFLALCEELSFTRAAKRCGVSQPSLTNGIRALEEELGGDLFTRRPHIAVTRLGSAVRPRLMRVAWDAEKVLEVARSLRRRLVYEPLSTVKRSGIDAGGK